MATITPSLTLTIKGDTKVKVLEQTTSWIPCEQDERNLKINATDGEQTIDLTLIDENLKLIVITSLSNFVVKLVNGVNTIEQETNLYVVTPGAGYLAGIDTFSIYTNSVDKINIDLRLYGETV